MYRWDHDGEVPQPRVAGLELVRVPQLPPAQNERQQHHREVGWHEELEHPQIARKKT